MMNVDRAWIETPKLHDFFSTHNLTDREIEIARLWMDNFSIRQISQTLFLSEGTVRNYTKSIYRKTGTSGRTDLINKVYRHIYQHSP